MGIFDNYCEGYDKIMINPPNVLFCLNVKITLNKWKTITKWKVTANWKEFYLTYLQLVGGVVEEKREKGKMSGTSSHDL